MAFDLSTAKPLEESGGFDLSTAVPVGEEKKTTSPGAEKLAAATNEGGILQYAKDTASNIPGSAWKLTKNLASMVLHPIDTATGLKDIVQGAGETAARDLLQLLPGYKAPDYSPKEQAFMTVTNPLTQSIMEPSGIPGRIKEFVKEDPVTALFNASMGIGGIGKTAEAAGLARTAATLGKVAEYSNPVLQGARGVTKTVKAAVPAIGRVVKESLGAYTGRGPGFVEEMIKGADAAENAMRGGITGEEVVSHAKEGLQKLRVLRGEEYLPKLEAIRANPEALQGVATDLNRTVTGLARPDRFDLSLSFDETGKLNVDFSRSTIVEHQNVVKRALEDVTGWTDNTAAGFDTLKKRLNTYVTQTGRDTPAKALVTQLEKEVSNGLKKAVPGYEDMTKGYREASNLIQDIESNLMLRKEGMTGRITADQTLRRLSSSLRENFEMRKDLLRALGNESGMDIPAEVAGYLAQQLIPAGLIGKGAGGAALWFGALKPAMWPVIAASSPRVVGEFLNAYGKAARSVREGASKAAGYAERAKTKVLGSGDNPLYRPEVMPGEFGTMPLTPAEELGRLLPPGQGFTKSSPAEARVILSEGRGLPVPPERLQLPPGQGFTNPTSASSAAELALQRLSKSQPAAEIPIIGGVPANENINLLLNEKIKAALDKPDFLRTAEDQLLIKRGYAPSLPVAGSDPITPAPRPIQTVDTYMGKREGILPGEPTPEIRLSKAEIQKTTAEIADLEKSLLDPRLGGSPAMRDAIESAIAKKKARMGIPEEKSPAPLSQTIGTPGANAEKAGGSLQPAPLTTTTTSGKLTPMVEKPGTANISPETTPKAVGGKESWQIPREDFVGKHQDNPSAWKDHFNSVYAALEQGKFVPDEVMKDFPNLAGMRFKRSWQMTEKEWRSQAKGINIIPNSQENVGRVINGEQAKGKIVGIRGIYREEIGKKKLKNSFNNPEGQTVEELPGSSAYDVNYGADDAIKRAGEHGNQDFIAIVSGEPAPQNIVPNDPHEIIIVNPKVVAYIPRSIHKEIVKKAVAEKMPVPDRILSEYPDLPNPSRPPKVGGQTVKKSAATGTENAQTFLERQGGVNFGPDYNLKLLKQDKDAKSLSRSTGMGPDAAAQLLNDAKILHPAGGEWTADRLAEAAKSNQLRKSFTPDKQDAILNRKIERDAHDYWNQEAANFEAENSLDAGTLESSYKEIIANTIAASDQKRVSIPDPVAAEKELNNFFTAKKLLKATETEDIPGASAKETFGLTSPKMKSDTGVLSKAVQHLASPDMFGKKGGR